MVYVINFLIKSRCFFKFYDGEDMEKSGGIGEDCYEDFEKH